MFINNSMRAGSLRFSDTPLLAAGFFIDGIYGDFSGMVFDHCKYEFKTLRRGQTFLSALAGPTCDSFDTLSLDVEIPELYVGDVVYVKNIGAYSSASAVANFNGFPPAKTVLV